jgi:hypothetical protein
VTELTQGGRPVHSLATRYNGTLFRSALEAKWAQAFDMLWIEWEYEVEAILLPNGTTYLPDFKLPRAGQFVEVKPHAFLTIDAMRKMTLLCEITSDVAPTLFRPEFQVVWCSDAGHAVAMQVPAGETHAKAMALFRPMVVRCPDCNLMCFTSGLYRMHDSKRICHACGGSVRLEYCGDPSKPYYGVHNG